MKIQAVDEARESSRRRCMNPGSQTISTLTVGCDQVSPAFVDTSTACRRSLFLRMDLSDRADFGLDVVGAEFCWCDVVTG